MDNLTHGLLGVTVALFRRRDGEVSGAGATGDVTRDGTAARAALSPTDRAVMLAALLAAELPDMDTFLGSGPLAGYTYHRGPTHSLLLAPLIALLATAVAKLIWRQARTGTVYLWSLVTLLTAHLLNDWMTGWGTRLLWPFSDARLGLDWVPIIDRIYTLPLLAAVLVAWRRPVHRRKAAALALAYLALYTVGFRAGSQALVTAAVRQHYAGQPVQKLRVAPDLFNPIRWQVTVDLGDRYELGYSYPFGALQTARSVPTNPQDPVVRAVRAAPELKPFFDQFAFTEIRYQQVTDGYEVQMADVRYQFAGRGMGFTAHLTPELTVRRIGR